MSPESSEKKIVIIAGPNGAGKTTFAREFLPREAGCPEFINADLIARGLSPFATEGAALRAGKGQSMKKRMQSRDPDIVAALPALRRAARAALKLGIQTRTPVYVVKDGKIVNINPNARKGIAPPPRPKKKQ